MADFNNLFGKDRDIVQEITRADGTAVQAGDLVAVAANNTELVGVPVTDSAGASGTIVTGAEAQSVTISSSGSGEGLLADGFSVAIPTGSELTFSIAGPGSVFSMTGTYTDFRGNEATANVSGLVLKSSPNSYQYYLDGTSATIVTGATDVSDEFDTFDELAPDLNFGTISAINADRTIATISGVGPETADDARAVADFFTAKATQSDPVQTKEAWTTAADGTGTFIGFVESIDTVAMQFTFTEALDNAFDTSTTIFLRNVSKVFTMTPTTFVLGEGLTISQFNDGQTYPLGSSGGGAITPFVSTDDDGDFVPLTAGSFVRVNAEGTGFEDYSLISGDGTTSTVSQSTVSNNDLVYVSFVPGTAGTTESSKLTYTSTGVDLTGLFAKDDLIYFNGFFTDSAFTAKWGDNTTSTYGYSFAFQIANDLVAPSDPVNDPWTIILDMNRPPFKAWVEASTTALVNQASDLGTPSAQPTSLITQQFFTDAVAAGGLNVSLRTEVSVPGVTIQTLANDQLSIAGIDPDGGVLNLTTGPFGTAGQSVIVNSTEDGLVFDNAGIDLSGSTAGTVQIVNTAKDGFDDSLISQATNGNIDIANSTNSHIFIDNVNNRVGMGLTSPNHQLHVHEPSTNSVVLQLSNDNTGSGSTEGVSMGITTDEDFVIVNRQSAGDIIFGIGTDHHLDLLNSGVLRVRGLADSVATEARVLGVTSDGDLTTTDVSPTSLQNENDSATNTTVKLWTGSQTQYNAIASKDAGTFYIIN